MAIKVTLEVSIKEIKGAPIAHNGCVWKWLLEGQFVPATV